MKPTLMLITVIKDPANISDHEINEVPVTTILADWIIDRYGPDGFSVPTRIFAGGVSDSQEIKIDDFDKINTPITSNIYIVHHPLGLSALAVFAIALIVGVAISLLIPVPKLPTGERRDKKSPNNSLSGQSNIARPLERVPDIFGQIKAYPDLISSTTFEYIDHILFSTEYMSVSRGFLDITEVKSGDTLISGIIGSSVQVYDPTETPTEVLKTNTSNEVKSLTLNPTNDSGTVMDSDFILDYLSGPDEARINGPGGSWDDYTIGSIVTLEEVYFNNGSTELVVDDVYTVSSVVQESEDLDGRNISYSSGTGFGDISGDFSSFTVGAYFTITEGIIDVSDRPLGDIDGRYKINSASASGIVLENAGSVNSSWVSLSGIVTLNNTNIEGDQEFITLFNASVVNANWLDASLPEPVLELLAITESKLLSPLAFLPDEVRVRGPFIVPGDNLNDEVWLDFSAPRGLVIDNNKNYKVTLSVLFEEVDAGGVTTGPSFTVNYKLKDNELNPRFYTRKVTASDGLELGKYYQVSAERTSKTKLNDSTLVDQITWTRLAGINDITETDDSGTTRVQIKTQATEQTSSLQDRKFNMVANRKVVTWNGSSVVGDIDTGVGLVASSRMADIFLHYSLDLALAARDITQIDVEAIFAIQDKLDLVFGGELGEFNYTFDNQNTPALEELRQIANAARCSVFREGSIISIVRDELQTISRALFNRRNKLPESETKTITFNKPLDNDGVQLEYRDKVDNKTKTILLPDDLETGDPNFNLPNTTNPIKVEATGVANAQQAWNRAQYELNRIIYNRVKVETSVTEEGILLPLNARIDHVDGTTLARIQSNGEITAVNGLTVTTSERCIFDPEKVYSVILRNDIGEPDTPITVSERSDTEFGFILVSAPSFTLFVRGENDYQVGTLYNFAPDGDELSNQYLVQRKQPDEHGNVTLELINYTDKYYQADNQVTPTNPSYSSGYDEGFE